MKVRLLSTWLAICGLVCLATCGERAPPAGAAEPWNSSANEARARNVPPPTHSEQDGFDLSSDGASLAIAFAQAPVNELNVVDLKTRNAIRIRGSNYRVKLAEASFSPDGGRVVLITTPPSYTGTAEVWLVDLVSGAARRIAAGERSYAFPVFSQDGTKIIYFREVPATADRPSGDYRPEYRAFVEYALAEHDLATGTERIFANPVALGPCGLFLDFDRQTAYFCANSARAVAATNASQPSPIGARTFAVKWNDVGGATTEIRFPQHLNITIARLEDVISSGDLLFASLRASVVQVLLFSPLTEEARTVLSPQRDEGPSAIQMSADGSVTVSLVQRAQSSGGSGPLIITNTIQVVRAGGASEQFSANRIVVSRDIVLGEGD